MKARIIILLILVSALVFVMGMWFCLPIQEAVEQKVLRQAAPDAPQIPQDVQGYTVELSDTDRITFYPLSDTQILCDTHAGTLTIYDLELGAAYGYTHGELQFITPLG